MHYWLLKTEPDAYGWGEHLAKGVQGDAWTGVRNHTAKRHLKVMRLGDRALFYHTGDEKQVVGIVEIIRESYPDPTDSTGKFVCVDVRPVAPLQKPVTLEAIKREPALSGMILVQQPRLSVQPVTPEQWAIICQLGGL